MGRGHAIPGGKVQSEFHRDESTRTGKRVRQLEFFQSHPSSITDSRIIDVGALRPKARVNLPILDLKF